MVAFFVGFLAAGLHIELIVMNPAGGQRREANVGGIGTERLDLPVAGSGRAQTTAPKVAPNR